MKKNIIILFILLFGVSAGFSQIKLGFRAGGSSIDISPKDIMTDQFKVKLDKVYFGIHGGVFLQAKFGRFFIQPEVLINSNKVDYQVRDIKSGIIDKILTEKYQYLDVPFMVGIKISALRFEAGPIGHYFLHSKSELYDIDGYEQNFDSFTFGWQAGLGLDLGKIVLDLKYEGNFSNYGDHIRIDNKEYNFDDKPSRLVFTIGYSFL